MQISVLSVPFLSAHIIARMQISALWTVFWLAPTKAIRLWISVPIANPSVRSNFIRGGDSAANTYKMVKEYEKDTACTSVNGDCRRNSKQIKR